MGHMKQKIDIKSRQIKKEGHRSKEKLYISKPQKKAGHRGDKNSICPKPGYLKTRTHSNKVNTRKNKS